MRKFLLTTLMALFALSSYAVTLNGAGATFPYPLYSKMFKEYHRLYGVKINYQAIGSGGVMFH